MATDTTTTDDEPVATDTTSDAAGSLHPGPAAAPSTGADLLRAAACALLVAGCVATPESAALIAPFVPVLVAIRLLRTRVGANRFLGFATVLSVAGVVGAATASDDIPWGMLVALLLVPGLGLVHARAALRDPASVPDQIDWPEPRLTSGMSVAVIGWVCAVLLLALAVSPAVDSPRSLGHDLIERAYEPIVDACGKGGALAGQEEVCEAQLAQRDVTLEVIDDFATELLAAFLAIFAWGAALTAHPIVIARTWRDAPRVRPPWRLRELEVHFVAAYLVAAALVAWLAAPGDSTVELVVRGVGVFAGTLGSLLLVAQGVGLAAWVFTNRRTPGWYRAVLVFGALLFVPYALFLLLLLGVIDMAARPRRRAAAKPTT